ncbi:MAG: hypothetical protein IJS09_05840 [Treponema sp.]|nr:hypothetical protein [Treponema sp.]
MFLASCSNDNADNAIIPLDTTERVTAVFITPSSAAEGLYSRESITLTAEATKIGEPTIAYTWAISNESAAKLSKTTGKKVELIGQTIATNTQVTVTVEASDGTNTVSSTYKITILAPDGEDNLTPYGTGTPIANPTVTAKWDFTTFKKGDIASGTELATVASVIDGKKTGTGATLDMNNVKGNSSDGLLEIASRSGSASLSQLEKAYSFMLTVDAATNLVIKAEGLGPVNLLRCLAVVNKTGRVLVAKDSLYSGKTVDFVVPGLPAGTYTVYINALKLYSIDCSVTQANLPAKPVAVTSLQLYDGSDLAKSSYSLEAIVDSLTLKAVNGMTSDDLTNEVTWESSDTNVATISYGIISPLQAGTTTISASIDSARASLVLTVTPCTKTIVTFIDKAKLPNATEVIDFTNLSDNVKAALTASVFGTSALTVTQATLTPGAALTEKTPTTAMSLGKAGTDLTSVYKCGLFWKDGGQLTATNCANLSFTVTPTNGKTLRLVQIQAQSYVGGGDKRTKIIPTINGTEGNAITVTKAWSIDSAAQDAVISSATPITVSFDNTKTDAGANSFCIQDLQLIFEINN